MTGILSAHLTPLLPHGAYIELRDGGGVWVSLLTAGGDIAASLASWQSQANAHGFLTRTDYAFSVSTTTGLVTFGAGGAFDLRLYTASATWDGIAQGLGFSASSYTGSASYVSDTTPGCYLIAPVDYDAPRSEDVGAALRTYRWGRSRAYGWHSAAVTTIRAYLSSAQIAAMQQGPLLSGRTRVYPAGYTSGAYSSSNPRGYLDVDPCGDVRIESLGAYTESSYLVSVKAVVL